MGTAINTNYSHLYKGAEQTVFRTSTSKQTDNSKKKIAQNTESGDSVSISKAGKEKVSDISDKSSIKAKDNVITLKDPIMDACSEYGTLISIDKDGVPQWEINPGNVDKFDKAVENGLKKFGGRDTYNFWMRLT